MSVVIRDPAEAKVEADLDTSDMRARIADGHWRILAFDYPRLDFVVAATEPNGTPSEYGFRADLTNFPSQAPLVRIWDFARNTPLAPEARPKGGQRVQISFQAWQMDTVYRAWDRCTGPHISNAAIAPHLAWHAGRHLSFIFEDLHVLLNANARASALRVSA